MKIRPVGAELFRADRTDGRTDWQTGMTKRIVAFRNFANAAKKSIGRPFSFLFLFIPWQFIQL